MPSKGGKCKGYLTPFTRNITPFPNGQQAAAERSRPGLERRVTAGTPPGGVVGGPAVVAWRTLDDRGSPRVEF